MHFGLQTCLSHCKLRLDNANSRCNNTILRSEHLNISCLRINVVEEETNGPADHRFTVVTHLNNKKVGTECFLRLWPKHPQVNIDKCAITCTSEQSSVRIKPSQQKTIEGVFKITYLMMMMMSIIIIIITTYSQQWNWHGYLGRRCRGHLT